MEKGVFNYKTDPITGIPRTSDTPNWHMGSRQWETDLVKIGDMQRTIDPEGWKQNQIVTASVHNIPESRQAVQKAMKNPDWYRQGSLKNGVFHIYLPSSIQLDLETKLPVLDKIRLDESWANQKRLESQALVLSSLLDTLKAGLVPGKKGSTKAWGFKPDFIHSGETFKRVSIAIIDMANHLKAVNKLDFAAPSASAWEELPYPCGMTSDTGMTVMAFEKLRDLLHNPSYEKYPGISSLRQALLNAPETEILKDKAALDAFIKAGHANVAEHIIKPLEAGEMPMQNPARKADTSLSILAASDYRFYSKDLTRDAEIRLGLVQAMRQALSGEHGMRRYNEYEQNGAALHDSYLNKNYHMPPTLREAMAGMTSDSAKSYGSGDASTIEAQLDRQALFGPETAAQWSLGETASLQALAKAKKAVLKDMAQSPSNGSPR